MKIVIATDAWRPQVNGVVHTLERMTKAATELGAEFEFVTPQGFATLPLPTYPDIRVALATRQEVGAKIERSGVDVSVNSPECGVVKAFCSSCRSGMDLKNGGLICSNCGRKESRKMSSEYPSASA